MKFIYNNQDDYLDAPHSYYDLYRFDDASEDEIFFYGYNCSINDSLKNEYKSYKRKIYYNWESPCSFYSRNDAVTSQLYFDEVYTLCPYTADYINRKYGHITKQIPVPYTIRTNHQYFSKCVSDFTNKEYDVLYQGQFCSVDHDQMYQAMINHKYAICSLGPNNYITHRNLDTYQKMDLISKSKVSLASNLLYLRPHQIQYCKENYLDYQDNEALIRIDEGIVPQFKSRIMEAAYCKSLNLVKYDPWNVIENWFIPDQEFIYYYDHNDLKNKLQDIISNYDNYIPIINRAHNKVMTYCIDEQIKKIINKQKI
jgi:hypothetical protein